MREGPERDSAREPVQKIRNEERALGTDPEAQSMQQVVVTNVAGGHFAIKG